jgi:hypothetical protein
MIFFVLLGNEIKIGCCQEQNDRFISIHFSPIGSLCVNFLVGKQLYQNDLLSEQ